MATTPMTKFVADNCIYLKAPSDDQLNAVIEWMATRGLIMETCQEGTAIFTKSGKGKPAPMVCIVYTAPGDPAAEATLNQLYPAPKDLKGIKVTNHEASEEQTEGMDGLADNADPIQAPAPGSVSNA